MNPFPGMNPKTQRFPFNAFNLLAYGVYCVGESRSVGADGAGTAHPPLKTESADVASQTSRVRAMEK